MEICRSADVPYATACRIVQTLMHEGLIERAVGTKEYRATALVQSLTTGFQQTYLHTVSAKPHLEKLSQEEG